MLLAGGAGSGSIIMIVVYVVFIGGMLYFMMVRPQKKEQKRKEEMFSCMEPGDPVMTTSGFYGVIIDITDEDVIVEFGNNKNCRIVMTKEAIAKVEKAE
jgi:preprotein translocase subunit YajC